jgi:hypothetical protein
MNPLKLVFLTRGSGTRGLRRVYDDYGMEVASTPVVSSLFILTRSPVLPTNHEPRTLRRNRTNGSATTSENMPGVG